MLNDASQNGSYAFLAHEKQLVHVSLLGIETP